MYYSLSRVATHNLDVNDELSQLFCVSSLVNAIDSVLMQLFSIKTLTATKYTSSWKCGSSPGYPFKMLYIQYTYNNGICYNT